MSPPFWKEVDLPSVPCLKPELLAVTWTGALWKPCSSSCPQETKSRKRLQLRGGELNSGRMRETRWGQLRMRKMAKWGKEEVWARAEGRNEREKKRKEGRKQGREGGREGGKEKGKDRGKEEYYLKTQSKRLRGYLLFFCMIQLFPKVCKKTVMPQCLINLQVNCLGTVGPNALPKECTPNTTWQTISALRFFYF